MSCCRSQALRQQMTEAKHAKPISEKQPVLWWESVSVNQPYLTACPVSCAEPFLRSSWEITPGSSKSSHFSIITGQRDQPQALKPCLIRLALHSVPFIPVRRTPTLRMACSWNTATRAWCGGQQSTSVWTERATASRLLRCCLRNACHRADFLIGFSFVTTQTTAKPNRVFHPYVFKAPRSSRV